MEPLPESPVAEALPSVKEMIALLEPVKVVDVTELVPEKAVEVVELVQEKVADVVELVQEKAAEVVEKAVEAVLSVDQAALVKLVTELVAKKPASTAEALELLGKLQTELTAWVVSELPAGESKALMMGLRAAEELKKFNWKSCFGLK